MKRTVLVFIVAVFFLILFIYITKSTSPWNIEAVDKLLSQKEIVTNSEFTSLILDLIKKGLIWQLINWKNFILWISIFGLSFVTLFMAIHLFIDKLFFKKYHENPNLFDASRRGIIVFLIMSGYIGLRIVSGQKWYNILGIIFLGVLIELIFINILHHKKSDSQ